MVVSLAPLSLIVSGDRHRFPSCLPGRRLASRGWRLDGAEATVGANWEVLVPVVEVAGVEGVQSRRAVMAMGVAATRLPLALLVLAFLGR